jgi:hypothetical protein
MDDANGQLSPGAQPETAQQPEAAQQCNVASEETDFGLQAWHRRDFH